MHALGLRSQPQSNAHSTPLLLSHDYYHTMLHHMAKTYGSFGHDKRSHQKKAALTKVKGTLLFKWLAAVYVLECVGATTSPSTVQREEARVDEGDRRGDRHAARHRDERHALGTHSTHVRAGAQQRMSLAPKSGAATIDGGSGLRGKLRRPTVVSPTLTPTLTLTNPN